jgi:hypothetical protein
MKFARVSTIDTIILIINYHVGCDKKINFGRGQKKVGIVGGLALKTILFYF